ncbi:TonB-dependent receptor [Mucilaginibacter boryungensis]|uniref:TonB-dependent receptor n=1 Tax=Mucilaginibacter boryungensis TaxID=768480 RepID=A0ABR9XCM1_9SPHI|nr:Plug domain-containing protein [Mucilaginibacter boryungensis]MBE9665147.1 hypothetical protein [Mucilaginibacter boryungensis]
MKRKFLICAAVLLSVALLQAHAQTDTTEYDLGHVKLQKKITQAITIKAADLEKLPFSNLSDAIAVWLNGYYNGKQTYVSIIDGNLNNDVNAYSIYDIEEITLIQNASVMLNGVKPSQLLLIVKTRRNEPGKSGLVVAGQTNAINSRNTSIDPSYKSTTNFYHQYYLSAYRNSEEVKAGISADYQHDVVPQLQNNLFTSSNPYRFDRFKFNGYLDVNVVKINTISINAGYVPQTNSNNFTTYSNTNHTILLDHNDNGKQQLWHGDIKISTHIIKGLTNELSAGLQHYQLSENEYNNIQPAFPPADIYTANRATKTNTRFIKDNLSYNLSTGKFNFEPNINFTYKKAIDSIALKSTVNNSPLYNLSYSVYRQSTSLLTPSLIINYANIIMLQGGFQSVLNAGKYTTFNNSKLAKAYPFTSVAINLIPAGKSAQLMVLGSYSKSVAALSDPNASVLQGIPDNATILFDDPNTHRLGSNFANPQIPLTPIATPAYNAYQANTQLQLGTSLSLLNNKLSFNYNYSIQKFVNTTSYMEYLSGAYYTLYLFPDARLDQHRFGLNLNLFHSAKFNWTSGLNATVVKYKLNFQEQLTASQSFVPNNTVFAGGFVNRINYKHAFAAIDILYRLNQDQYAPNYVVTGHFNSFDVQNLYAGYTLTSTRFKNLEVFADARNLIQNKQSDIAYDNRRYFGAGFKLGL